LLSPTTAAVNATLLLLYAAGGGMGIYTGPRKLLGPGELFGEISFFTEIPQMENVR
jgi:CRP-like cAMP-binding protein